MPNRLNKDMSKIQHGEFDLTTEQVPLVAMGTEKTVIPATEVSKELLRIKGKWPFDLYPDELIIEEKRIIIKKNLWPFFSNTITIPLSRLTDFELNKSLLFSSIYIRGAYSDNIEITLSWLPHKDAKKAKEIIDGLSLKLNEALDIVEQDTTRFIRAIRALGQTY